MTIARRLLTLCLLIGIHATASAQGASVSGLDPALADAINKPNRKAFARPFQYEVNLFLPAPVAVKDKWLIESFKKANDTFKACKAGIRIANVFRVQAADDDPLFSMTTFPVTNIYHGDGSREVVVEPPARDWFLLARRNSEPWQVNLIYAKGVPSSSYAGMAITEETFIPENPGDPPWQYSAEDFSLAGSIIARLDVSEAKRTHTPSHELGHVLFNSTYVKLHGPRAREEYERRIRERRSTAEFEHLMNAFAVFYGVRKEDCRRLEAFTRFRAPSPLPAVASLR